MNWVTANAMRVVVPAVRLDPRPVATDRLANHLVAVVRERAVDEVVLGAEVPRLHRAATGDPHRRVRLLPRARHGVDVALLVEPAVERERLGRLPRLHDQSMPS